MKDCLRYKRNVAMRKDSLFVKSKLKLQKWIHIIYCWSNEISEMETYRSVHISQQSVVDLYNYSERLARDIMSLILSNLVNLA